VCEYKSFMELADKHGILIVDELIDKWSDKSYWGGRVPSIARSNAAAPTAPKS